MTGGSQTGVGRGLPLLRVCLPLLWLAACSSNVGTLQVELVRSWDASQDPLANASFVRLRVDGPGVQVGPETFSVADREGTLAQVPVGDQRLITVEALGPERNVVARGRSGPISVVSGENRLGLYLGLVDAFSFSSQKLSGPRAFHGAAPVRDGLLLTGGVTQNWRPEKGQPPPAPTRTTELLDGNSLRVSPSPAGCAGSGKPSCLVQGRVGHSTTLLQSGNVLVAGGLTAGGGPAPADGGGADTGGAADGGVADGGTGDTAGQLARLVEVYQAADGRFFRGAALTTPREDHRAASNGESVVLAGGRAGGASGTATRAVERYSQGSLSALPGLLQGRRAFTLTRLPDGALLAAGGLDRDDHPLASLEQWRPGAARWKTLAARLQVARGHHSATLLADGSVLFAGGLLSTTAAGKATDALERYVPATGELTTLTGHLRLARWAHSATLLTDGRVIVVGGFGGGREGSPSHTVEEIRLFSGGVVQVRPLANLNEVRAGHSATLLPSGWLLVAGGLSVVRVGSTLTLRPADSAEVFIY
jgi:hypothetical protein